MSIKGLTTIYEWQINGLNEWGEGEDCWHWDIDDTDSVITDLTDDNVDVEILKRRGSNDYGEISRDYFQLNFHNKPDMLDETDQLPKYIQKYVNKVKEGLSCAWRTNYINKN